MKKKSDSKAKRIKKAIGRLSAPAPKVIEDKREKLLRDAERLEEDR